MNLFLLSGITLTSVKFFTVTQVDVLNINIRSKWGIWVTENSWIKTGAGTCLSP